jgi:predicted Rossmann-fold nucleotide-binding protein
MFPIIIFDKEFYKSICEHSEKMLKAGTISPKDKDLYLVTDSIPQAIGYIKEKSIAAFGLTHMKAKKPFFGFFEKKFPRVFTN